MKVQEEREPPAKSALAFEKSSKQNENCALSENASRRSAHTTHLSWTP